MEWLLQCAAVARGLLFALLRLAGPVPRHIAFVMDGNRRFAKRSRLQRHLGHEQGSQKVTIQPPLDWLEGYQFVEVVRWCLELGVPYISVYAFSIENFKRSNEEVEELMRLAKKEYKRFEVYGLVEGFHAEVRVIGDLVRTDRKLQGAAAQLMKRTEETSRQPIVNICFSYAASQEICRAVEISQHHLKAEPTVRDIEKLCLTEDCPEVDLVIRTSGEKRLSDFLTLQCRNAKIVFNNVLWPEYSLWDFCSALLDYGRDFRHLQSLKHHSNGALESQGVSNDTLVQLCSRLAKQKRNWIHHHAKQLD